MVGLIGQQIPSGDSNPIAGDQTPSVMPALPESYFCKSCGQTTYGKELLLSKIQIYDKIELQYQAVVAQKNELAAEVERKLALLEDYVSQHANANHYIGDLYNFLEHNLCITLLCIGIFLSLIFWIVLLKVKKK
ncbi:MAG: hypothetical protein ACK4ON_05170 [Bacteroidia bacterium]